MQTSIHIYNDLNLLYFGTEQYSTVGVKIAVRFGLFIGMVLQLMVFPFVQVPLLRSAVGRLKTILTT